MTHGTLIFGLLLLFGFPMLVVLALKSDVPLLTTGELTSELDRERRADHWRATREMEPMPAFHDSLPALVSRAAGDMADDVLESLKGKYANKRPKKVHSTLVLGLESGHRKKVIMRFLRTLATDEEFKTACHWMDQEHHRFDDLLARRIAIMQSSDRQNITQLLEYNDIAAQLLTRKIHTEMVNKLDQQRRNVSVADSKLNHGNR